MLGRLFRRPWSLAVLVIVIVLLAAAVLAARPDGASLFGAVPSLFGGTFCFCR